MKIAKGFSLVEMSVVLSSVAAVIAIVFGGQAIIEKTKRNSIITEVGNFTYAIEQFEATYGSLPGDIADTSKLSNSTAGNGNGIIDNETEALMVWRHLSLAGLIEGSYDGTSAFEPGKGIPKSSKDGGAYSIKLPELTSLNNDSNLKNDIPNQAIIIELAHFDGTPGAEGVLKPKKARDIDKKMDDGKPLQGKVLAEGVGVSCVNNKKYNKSALSQSCRLLFVIKNETASDKSEIISGKCTELGQTRVVGNHNKTCPIGYQGKVIETCRIDSTNQGRWEVTNEFCEEVKCGTGAKYGDKRKLQCINGLKGNEGITEQCSENGVWKVIDSDCEFFQNISCNSDGKTKRDQACSWGETGYILQSCVNNKWEVPSKLSSNYNCKAITCGSLGIGESRESDGCGDDFNGKIREICTIAGTLETTSIGSTCVPNYKKESCTFGSSQNKNIGCPPGQSGKHILTCIDAEEDYWTTFENTCKPSTCSGGYNIGSSRVRQGSFCPNGSKGTVMEYCKVNPSTNKPEWKEVLTNCVIGICPSSEDREGNAIWPTTASNKTATAVSCVDGYTKDSLAPTRKCVLDANGVAKWEKKVDNPCKRKKCPELVFNNATYPKSNAGESDIQGACDLANGYSAPEGFPIMDCDINGMWKNERVQCQGSCPLSKKEEVGAAGIRLWYDAADSCTVFADNDCTEEAKPGSDNVGCLKDKSGNGFHATQRISSYRPAYTGKSKGKNNHPTINFNGNDNALKFPNIGGMFNTTAFIVHKAKKLPTSPDVYSSIITSDSEKSKNVWLYHGYNGVNYTSFEVMGRLPAEVFEEFAPTEDYIITTVTDNDKTSSIYNNGELINSIAITQTADNTTSSPQDMASSQQSGKAGSESADIKIIDNRGSKKWGPGTIGAWYEGSNIYYEHLEGYIAEIIIFDSLLSDSKRKAVESYLTKKWNIQKSDIFNDTKLWYDASDEGTVLINNTCDGKLANPGVDKVGCWKDKSGNDFHATQTQQSYKPFYTSPEEGKNDLPTLKFDGAKTKLAYPDIGEFDETTVYAIHKEDSYPSAGQVIIGSDGWKNKGTFLFFEQNYNSKLKFWVEGRNPTKIYKHNYSLPNVYNLTSAYDDNKVSEIHQNGTSIVSKNITTTFTKKWGPGLVGAWNWKGYRYHHIGNIGEIIIFDKALSSKEKSDMDTYLIDKWGISEELDDGDNEISIDNAVLWLDATKEDSMKKSNECHSSDTASLGSNIGCWMDQSGSNNHAKQQKISKRPLYKSNAINSKPAVEFDRMSFENLYIPNSSGNDFDVVGNITATFVTRFDNLGNYWSSFFSRGTDYANPFDIGAAKEPNSNAYRLYFDLGDNTWGGTGGVESKPGSIKTNTDYIFTLRSSGPATYHFVYINGSLNNQAGATVYPSNSNDKVYIGNFDGSSSHGLDGKIGEIIFMPQAISDNKRREIEKYLGEKWGISVPF